MDKPPVEFSADQQAIQAVAKAIRSQIDGKQLRKDLITEMRQAVQPGIAAVSAKLRAIPRHSAAAWTHGGKESNQALGAYLAARIKPQVKLSGRTTGVRVRIGRTDKIRKFSWAARRLNSTRWRHKVYGRDVWVEQRSPIPGYFDGTLSSERGRYRRAVIEALERMAKRIAAAAR